MGRIVSTFIALAVLATALFVGRARADTDGPVLRLHRVGALTHGRPSYLRPQEPVVTPDMVSDEERPLFGAVGEEPWYPLGTVDELVEQVKSIVEPSYWERTEGADIATQGEDAILVRASPQMQDAVARFLDDQLRRLGRTVTVDLRAVRIAPDAARQVTASSPGVTLPDDVAARLLHDAAPGPSLSLTCLPGQPSVAWVGREATWICDADVEVAQDASTSDPIVSTSNLGLMAQIRPTLEDGGHSVLLELDLAWADMGAPRALATARNGTLEAPPHRVVTCRPTLHVPVGRWAVADARAEGPDGGWILLARATPHPYETTGGRPAAIDLGAAVAPGTGDMASRSFGVGVLTTPICARRSWSWRMDLVPSRYTPPEPPELPEPLPAVSLDQLVEIVRAATGEACWEEPASLDARGDRIIARNRPGVLDRAAGIFDELAARLAENVVVEAEVLDVSPDLASRLDARGALGPPEVQALAAARAAGEAHTLAAVRLVARPGVPNGVASGDEVPYLADYYVEIAEKTAIGNPVVLHAFSGVSLDVDAAPSPDGGSVLLNVSYARNELARPFRTRATEHGEIELPSMGVERFRTSVEAPLGRPLVLSAWTEGERHRILVLTPRIE